MGSDAFLQLSSASVEGVKQEPAPPSLWTAALFVVNPLELILLNPLSFYMRCHIKSRIPHPPPPYSNPCIVCGVDAISASSNSSLFQYSVYHSQYFTASENVYSFVL